jgi:hypothetical protein
LTLAHTETIWNGAQQERAGDPHDCLISSIEPTKLSRTYSSLVKNLGQHLLHLLIGVLIKGANLVDARRTPT